jgi:hypothetical protein
MLAANAPAHTATAIHREHARVVMDTSPLA